MALGYYSSSKSSTVQPKDVEIYFTYAESRNVTPVAGIKATKLDALQILQPIQDETNNLLGGSYNLTLPATIFNKIGIYNIFIVPKKSFATIIDCGVLSTDSSKRGIVLDINDDGISNIAEYLINDGLVGYSVEYLDSNNNVVPNFFKAVTSCNICEPVADNSPNSIAKQIKYRFNDNSSLLFLTLTPSSVSSVKPTSKPFIGNVGDVIKITNGYFEPIMLEVDFVEYGIQELGYGIFGSQTKSTQDGIVTVYDNKDEIYSQSDLYQIQDEFGVPLYDVREKRELIDTSKDLMTITKLK